MKHLLKFSLAVVFGIFLCAGEAETAQQRVNIRLGGTYCEFYLLDVAKALKQISGVKDLDFETMRGHVIVTLIAGKVRPTELLSAIKGVKGEGYHCKGQFEGEPGKVEG